MQRVEPRVHLISQPQVDYDALYRYLKESGGEEWLAQLGDDLVSAMETIDAQNLAEFMGRLCYKSWKPGLNPNVTKVRTEQTAYLLNILSSHHGSVLEHLNFSFVFSNVSRTFTHELVRHRAGTAISQESLRYVRVIDIPFWIPDWVYEDEDLLFRVLDYVKDAERFQQWMSQHFHLDDAETAFAEKKAKTSFMRRLLPEGVATNIGWTANVRALRHIIETRTAPGAEEEMRQVFLALGAIMIDRCPALFSDFTLTNGSWVPQWRKV